MSTYKNKRVPSMFDELSRLQRAELIHRMNALGLRMSSENEEVTYGDLIPHWIALVKSYYEAQKLVPPQNVLSQVKLAITVIEKKEICLPIHRYTQSGAMVALSHSLLAGDEGNFFRIWDKYCQSEFFYPFETLYCGTTLATLAVLPSRLLDPWPINPRVHNAHNFDDIGSKKNMVCRATIFKKIMQIDPQYWKMDEKDLDKFIAEITEPDVVAIINESLTDRPPSSNCIIRFKKISHAILFGDVDAFDKLVSEHANARFSKVFEVTDDCQRSLLHLVVLRKVVADNLRREISADVKIDEKTLNEAKIYMFEKLLELAPEMLDIENKLGSTVEILLERDKNGRSASVTAGDRLVSEIMLDMVIAKREDGEIKISYPRQTFEA